MHTFPELIKNIRREAGLTQADFASVLGVSKVLISMVETGQKEVSKSFVQKLAELMEVHPATITPFLFMDKEYEKEKLGPLEKKFLQWGEKMQKQLIQKKSQKIKKNAKNNLPKTRN